MCFGCLEALLAVYVQTITCGVMGSSHQVELCHMSTRLCERIHSTRVPSSRVIGRFQLFFLPDCVMVVWRTKVQCDAHGQVGG